MTPEQTWPLPDGNEVMTDALYAAVGAVTSEEMESARASAADFAALLRQRDQLREALNQVQTCFSSWDEEKEMHIALDHTCNTSSFAEAWRVVRQALAHAEGEV